MHQPYVYDVGEIKAAITKSTYIDVPRAGVEDHLKDIFFSSREQEREVIAGGIIPFACEHHSSHKAQVLVDAHATFKQHSIVQNESVPPAVLTSPSKGQHTGPVLPCKWHLSVENKAAVGYELTEHQLEPLHRKAALTQPPNEYITGTGRRTGVLLRKTEPTNEAAGPIPMPVLPSYQHPPVSDCDPNQP
ncbi:hypothetical protein AcW1_006955 [Taiwanofungus camphoratus]|nr:hypothetical protein AcW1_006955 [Antrodia cinnamomea]